MADAASPPTTRDLTSELSKLVQSGDLEHDAQSRQEALRISRLITASLQTPQELAFETCFLPAYSACCRAGIHLRLFEAVAAAPGPVTAGEIAAQTGSEQLLVVRLLRVITGLGLVAEVGPERYAALPATRAMTLPMMRAAHQHFWDQGAASLLQLPSYLEANGPKCPTDSANTLFQQAYRTPLDAFSYWQAVPPPRRALDNFNFLMTCVRGEEPAWLSWFPVREQMLEGLRPEGPVMVDVGGGRGHDDLPGILDEVDAAALPGVEKVGYDFFTPQTVQGARVYYFAHILHDWSDAAAARILANTRSAMAPGYSRVYLYEFILPETHCSMMQAGFDMQMLAMHSGMERTEAQWTRLLEGQGFVVRKFWRPDGPDMEGIIEAEVREELA